MIEMDRHTYMSILRHKNKRLIFNKFLSKNQESKVRQQLFFFLFASIILCHNEEYYICKNKK
jgi:hypothetical protein